MGLIDDNAVVACNGVTACDHAKSIGRQGAMSVLEFELKSGEMNSAEY